MISSPNKTARHEHWMRMALNEARKAQKAGEVPSGAVAVSNGKLLSKGHTRSIRDSDPSAHAEIVVLRRAAQKLKNYRLNGIILYTTLEPCPMCAGALIWARVQEVVIGAPNTKAGACGTVFDVRSFGTLNHRFEVTTGILKKESQALLKVFFSSKR